MSDKLKLDEAIALLKKTIPDRAAYPVLLTHPALLIGAAQTIGRLTRERQEAREAEAYERERRTLMDTEQDLQEARVRELEAFVKKVEAHARVTSLIEGARALRSRGTE